MLQKCVSYIMSYIIVVKVFDSFLIDTMDFMDWEERNNWRSKKLLLCNISKTKEENINYFLCIIHIG